VQTRLERDLRLYRRRFIKCNRALVEELKELVIRMLLPAELSLLTWEALSTQLRHIHVFAQAVRISSLKGEFNTEEDNHTEPEATTSNL